MSGYECDERVSGRVRVCQYECVRFDDDCNMSRYLGHECQNVSLDVSFSLFQVPNQECMKNSPIHCVFLLVRKQSTVADFLLCYALLSCLQCLQIICRCKEPNAKKEASRYQVCWCS